MKKTKGLRLFALLLCLILLASCQPNEQPDGKTEESSTQEPSGYIPSENELLLIADEQAYCGIVYPQDGSKAVQTMCADIAQTIRQTTGVNVKRYTDGGQIPDGSAEILIGDTNRAETAQAKKALGEYEYSVSVINGKVVVVGADAVMLEYAVAHLLGLIQDGANNGVLTLAKDYGKKICGYTHNAYIGKGVGVTIEYTQIKGMSPIGATTSAGGSETYRWIQGGCTDGTYYYYCMTTNDQVVPAKGIILKYELATQKLVKVSAEVNMGHMNDAAYNLDNHTILISELKVKQNASDEYTYTNKHYVIDPDTLTVKDTVEFPASGTVAYDDVRNRYICSTNEYLWFYDDQFKRVKSVDISDSLFSKYETDGKHARQGITCDEKYIYQLVYWQNSANSKDIRCEIAVYDIETGAYVQRITLNMGREVENIGIWNNCFYIVCNNLAWTGAECYQVKVIPQ